MTKKEIHDSLLSATAEAEKLNAKVDRTADEDAKLDELMAAIEKANADLLAVAEKEKADKERADKLAATRKTLGTATAQTRRPQPGGDGIGHIRQAADDDPKAGFKSHREFLTAVMDAAVGRTDERLSPLRAAAGSDEHGEYSDSYGGYLIPEGLLPGLMKLSPPDDPIGARTTKIPMAAPTVRINYRVDKNHTSSVSGGLRVYRRAETDDVLSSRMQFKQVTLNAHSLMGVSYATEELLQDSPISFVSMIQQGFGDEFANKLAKERFRGTGTGEYEGILNSPALVTVSKEGSQTADTIVYKNVVNMRSRIYRYSDAIWTYNPDCLPTLMNMVDGDNRLIWQSSARDGEPDMFLGRPAFPNDYCATVGDKGDIVLATWSEYLEGTLQSQRFDESIHVRFLNNERCFRATVRNDGRSWWETSYTPPYSANTRSPFVVLEDRA